MYYDDADEIRDTVSLNEFLSQPSNTQTIEAIQFLTGNHPDQIDPRYLTFYLQIEGIAKPYSIKILDEDYDGMLTESLAERLAEEIGADILPHLSSRVFRKSFKNKPIGNIITH